MADAEFEPRFYELLRVFSRYRLARLELLSAIRCVGSNRDPLPEFSEQLALAALGGTLAESRVQAGWDFMDLIGRRVQVRCLANPIGRWVNEHLVDFRDGGCDLYALVFFAAFDVEAIVVFDGQRMNEVGAALGKTPPNQERTLQLTQLNYKAILASPDRFLPFGVQVIDLRTTT